MQTYLQTKNVGITTNFSYVELYTTLQSVQNTEIFRENEEKWGIKLFASQFLGE